VFVVVAWTSVAPLLGPDDVRALWSAVVPLVLILVQAGVYWLAARSWVGVGRMPPAVASAYRAMRVANVVMLAAGLVGAMVWWQGSPLVALMVLAIWLFGVAEHVNYYVVRLAYPPSRWFSRVRAGRTPTLWRDMRSARSARPRHI
jgi:hypothetical protein